MKLTDEDCSVIINAFKQDKKVGWLPQDFLDRLKNIGFVGYEWRVQVWLFTANRHASDSLWEKKDDVATQWLKKLGLTGKNSTSRPGTSKHYIGAPRDSGKFSSPKHDWKYVK